MKSTNLDARPSRAGIRRLLVLCVAMSLWPQQLLSQTLEEIDRYCGGPCTAAIQIENFTPGNSVFAFPLESETDFGALRAFVQRNVPSTLPLDISIVAPGEATRTEIVPFSPSAIALHNDLIRDREGQEMARSLGLRSADPGELSNPLNTVANGLRQGFSEQSTVQLVKVSPDNLIQGDFGPLGSDQEANGGTERQPALQLADAAAVDGDPKSQSFWQNLRNDIRANKGQFAASVILGSSVAGVNSATIILNSGASLPQAMIVGALMGTVTGTMNFWTVRLSRWYGNGRWIFQRNLADAQTPGTFGRFLRMNSKRAFVGWTLGLLFRMTFRATGIMPGGPSILDPVEVASNTLYGVVNGYPWAKVAANISREEGRPLPGAFKRIMRPATLSFVLTLAYQAGSVLYHIPGHEFTGRVVVGLISAVGVPFWIYQSVDVGKVVKESMRRVKSFGRAVWCNFLQGSFAFNGAY